MYLYRLTNEANGLVYIGATRQPLARRLYDHRRAAGSQGRTYLICAAIRMYGWVRFRADLLATAGSYGQLMQMETDAIREHGSLAPGGYNMTAGGVGTPSRLHGPTTRRRISTATQGRRPWNYGKRTGPMSETARAKQRAAHLGQPAWNKGIPATAETRRKLSVSHAGARSWRACPIEMDGVRYSCIKDACAATGLSIMQVKYRLLKGRAMRLPKPT